MNFDKNRKIFQWFWAIDQVFFKYISGFRPKYMDATDFFEIKNSQMENTNHHILTFWPFFYTLHCLLIWISSGRSRKNNHCNYNLDSLFRIAMGSGKGITWLKIYLCSDINSFGLINWKSSIIISIGWVPSKIFKLVGAHLILHQNSMKAKFVEAEEMLVFFDLESELQEVNIPLNNSTYLWYPAERNQQQASITSSSEYTLWFFA